MPNLQDPAFRRAIYDRDGGLCGFCGKPVDFKRMHVDHITPRSMGGSNAVDNLRPAHASCNIEAGQAARRGRSFTPLHLGRDAKVIAGDMPAEMWHRIDAIATQTDRSFNATALRILSLGLDAIEAQQAPLTSPLPD